MIRKSLLSLTYISATIQRWNDHIRPSMGFTELDKQAHKLYYAYILAKCENEANGNVNMLWLIEGGMFEFLQRVILTDIKPPVYHRLMNKKGDEINQWVFGELENQLVPLSGGFFERLKRYFTDPMYSKKEKDILKAAHFLATDWEFEIVYNLNSPLYTIENTKKEFKATMDNLPTFEGLKLFMNDEKLKGFTNFIGQLRFQQRWSRTARVPNTFVMGHMLIVAMFAYFTSIEIGACDKRIVNNFIAGLFHDLPEVLTRDIVSPVKNGVTGLDHLIKEIENEQMEEILAPLLPKKWYDDILYLTVDEFKSRIKDEAGNTKNISSDDITKHYNSDKYSPIDGELIRACDHLSAYMETYLSMRAGISSPVLLDAHNNLFRDYENKIVAGVDFGQLFDYFKM